MHAEKIIDIENWPFQKPKYVYMYVNLVFLAEPIYTVFR